MSPFARVTAVVVLVTAGLAVFPSGPAATAAGAAGGATPTASDDRNRNRVADELDANMARGDPQETMRVVARVDTVADANAAAESVGAARRFERLPVVAASLTPAEINGLAQQHGVIEVMSDVTAHATLDTARAAAGVDKAATDFGVNGDLAHDGTKHYGTGDVVAAVIDSGIDAAHVDLDEGKVLHFENFVTNAIPCTSHPPGAVAPFDDEGHGTHVSSILAGEGDGDAGHRGVAPGAALVGVRVLDCQGNGAGGDIFAGLDWVLAHGAEWNVRVANLSFGFTGGDDGTGGVHLINQVVNQIVASGIEMTVAAGNNGPRAQSLTSPGDARFGLSVGAISDPLDTDISAAAPLPPGWTVAFFSGRGPSIMNAGIVKPDVVAPGVDISAADHNTASGYVTMSGTSMASPFTAGVAALMINANPALRPSGTACNSCFDGVTTASMTDPIADRLRSSAVDWGTSGSDPESGFGRLDAYQAITSAVGAPTLGGPTQPCHFTVTGQLTPTVPTFSQTVTVTDTRWPISAGAVLTGWTATDTPNVSIAIIAPGGSPSSTVTSHDRQPDNGVPTAVTGTGAYTVRLTALQGLTVSNGGFILDISATATQAVPSATTSRDCGPSVVLSRPTGPLRIPEGGATSNVIVALQTPPASLVTVDLTAPAGVTLTPSQVTFDPGANDVGPKTVAVGAVDDNLVQPDRTPTITATASGDAAYVGQHTSTPSTILEDDVANIVLSGAPSVSEQGPTSSTYGVALRAQPNPGASVVIHLTPDVQVTASPPTLTFTNANWSTPQTVTVTAVDDSVVEPPPQIGRVHHTLTSLQQAAFNDVVGPDAIVSITDNDLHGLAGGGYRMVASDGGIFAFGDAGFFGSTGGIHLNQPIVGMASTPSGQGYWLVARDGGIFAFGDAGFFGSTGGIHLNQPIVGMASTPSGHGYWLVASDGGIFAFGDAGFFGSTGGIHLNQPIVGMASTPSGQGYWLVASDGGLFAFGDGGFFGSTGGSRLNSPVIAMAATPDGGGYWLLAADGGIFTFGNAAFVGSTGSQRLNAPIVGFAATPFGAGYWLVASDGGIFAFGDAGFFGSMGGTHINRPIVQMSA